MTQTYAMTPPDTQTAHASAPPRETGGGAHALPATGLVLIGTAFTVRAMTAHLATLPYPPVVAGCVLLSRLTGHRDGPELPDMSPPPPLPPVLGFLENLIELHARHRFRYALVCVPPQERRALPRLMGVLDLLSIPSRVLPTLEDLLNDAAGIAPQRPPAPPARPRTLPVIDPQAFLGRQASPINREQVARVIGGRRVLITGAGGSIGSEIARVCAEFAPESIVLMERAENALFQIDHELARRAPALRRTALLHDVVDHEQTLRLCLDLRPQVVFHAAAHKHVPLMEDHPAHALNNNLFGTRSIADAARACAAERFVLISSDKAVNPTSIMGATKRLAELYVASLAAPQGPTRFSMVRFGNVLGSAGSVLPIWTAQLLEGSPLSVTDPRMTRYFMTIPEAAALVIQAGALHEDPGVAPVFVLDMGRPVRILDLARRFARLSGFRPIVDESTCPDIPAAREALRAALAEPGHSLPPDAPDPAEDALPAARIAFTGARPGEKLYEELAYSAETLAATAHPAISRWTAPGSVADPQAALRMIAELSAFRAPAADKAGVVAAIARHVPEMRRPDPRA
jgi:FlaA1/EpsC-like NDP-sugar epimerase